MSSFVTYLICGFINPTFPQLILVEIDDCYTTVGLCRHAGGKPLDPKAQGRGGGLKHGLWFRSSHQGYGGSRVAGKSAGERCVRAVGQRPAGQGTERIKGFIPMKRPGIRVRDVRKGLRLEARRIGTDARRHGSRWRRTCCGVQCLA